LVAGWAARGGVARAHAAQDGIVFARMQGSPATENDEIWTMRADGTEQKRLTHNLKADREPAWSPSGKLIAWDHYQDQFGGGLSSNSVMRADGSGKRP